MERFASLILSPSTGQEQKFVLEKPSIIMGRGTTNDIVVADAKVSRIHARLEIRDDGYRLTDIGSANGTKVNGETVSSVLLASGDTIGLGDSTLRFTLEVPEVPQEIIAIESEADIDATLAHATVQMKLASSDTPRLVVYTARKTWDVLLTLETLTIGRHRDSDLVLEQAKVSRHHAVVERLGTEFRIRDLDSTNGTWFGAVRIDQRLLRNGDTVRIGDTHLVFKSGFSMDDLTLTEERWHGATASHPLVVFVPGMMGSQLWRGTENIWPNVKNMFTQPEIYMYQPNDGVVARGIVGDVVLVPNLVRQQRYGRLGDFLEETLGYTRGHNLLEFAYDWRQDLRVSAQELAATLEGWADARPVTIIAHSLGCMVSRYYVERLGGKNKVGRLILLGGPHAGYPKAIAHLLSGSSVLPFGLLGERVRKVIATFPAIYQILPTASYVSDAAGNPYDVLADDTWLAAAKRPLLRDARAFRRELGMQTSVPTVSIFGYGLKTITGVRMERGEAEHWLKANFDLQDHGDTDLPASSAVLPGSEIHPVQQHHGSLYVDNDVKMRLRLELTR